MPTLHREFILALKNGPSLHDFGKTNNWHILITRQNNLNNYNQRQSNMNNFKSLDLRIFFFSVETTKDEDLTRAYNETVTALADFRTGHIGIVTRSVPQ